MAREKSGDVRNARLASLALQSSLLELRSQLVHIEQGNNLACRTLCVILRRILVEELPIASQNNPIEFASFLSASVGENSAYPLTMLQVTTHGTRIVPLCLIKGIPRKKVSLKSWRREIVFNKDADEFSFLPSVENPRKSLAREEFIDFVRNEVGAHYSRDVSKHFKAFDSSFSPLDLRIVDQGGVKSEKSGKPPHRFNYMAATAACIAVELIFSVSVKDVDGFPQLAQL